MIYQGKPTEKPIRNYSQADMMRFATALQLAQPPVIQQPPTIEKPSGTLTTEDWRFVLMDSLTFGGFTAVISASSIAYFGGNWALFSLASGAVVAFARYTNTMERQFKQARKHEVIEDPKKKRPAKQSVIIRDEFKKQADNSMKAATFDGSSSEWLALGLLRDAVKDGRNISQGSLARGDDATMTQTQYALATDYMVANRYMAKRGNKFTIEGDGYAFLFNPVLIPPTPQIRAEID